MVFIFYYICLNFKNKTMKKNSILAMIGFAFLAVSCGSDAPEEVVVEDTVYSLNTEESTLWWRGEENAEHFHTGNISFSEGTFTMNGENVVSGDFKIDPNTLTPNTEGYPAEKMAYLKSHLLDTAFLFTAEYPNITVKTAEYKDGKLKTTINVRGVDLETEVPVTIDQKENDLWIKGEFTVDFAKTMMPYITEINPETGAPGAKSGFQFKMDLKLSK